MGKSKFDGLLDEIEESLRKSALPADEAGNPEDKPEDSGDDGRIASASGHEDETETDSVLPDGSSYTHKEGDDDEDEKEENEEESMGMGKALRVKLEDGDEFEAFDGTKIVQSLAKKVGAQETQFAKALNRFGTVMKSVADQSARHEKLLKSLTERMDRIANEGRGRRAAVTIHEKPAATVEKPDGVSGEEFLSKALSLQKQGKLSASIVARSEAYINAGLAPPDDVVRAVAEAA